MADVSPTGPTACVNDLIRIRDALHTAWSEATTFGVSHLAIPGGARSFSYEFLKIPQKEDIDAALQPYPAENVRQITNLGRESIERGKACMAFNLPKTDVAQTEVILESIRSAIHDLLERFGESPRGVVSKTAEEVKPVFFRDRVAGREAYYFTRDEIETIWAGVSGVNGLANAVHNMALDLIKAQGQRLGHCHIDPSIRDVDQFSVAFCESNYSGPTLTADGRIHSPLGVHKAVLKLSDVGGGRRKVDLEYTESGDGYNCSASRLDAFRKYLRTKFGLSCDEGTYSMDCKGEFHDPKQVRTLGAFLPQLRDMDLYLFCDCIDEAMSIAYASAEELAGKEGILHGPHKVYETTTGCYASKSPAQVAEAKSEASGEFEGSDTEDEDNDEQEEDNSNTTKWWVDLRVPWSLTCKEVYSYLADIDYYTPKKAEEKTASCERGLAKARENGMPLKYYVTVPRKWKDGSGESHVPWAEIESAQDGKRAVVANVAKDGSPLVELTVESPVGEFDKFFKTHVSCNELLRKGAITREQFEACSKVVNAGKDWSVQVTQHDLDFMKFEHSSLQFESFPVSPFDTPFSRVEVVDSDGCRALFEAGALTREEMDKCEQIVRPGDEEGKFPTHFIHTVTAEEAGNLLEQARELIAKGRMILQAVFVA